MNKYLNKAMSYFSISFIMFVLAILVAFLNLKEITKFFLYPCLLFILLGSYNIIVYRFLYHKKVLKRWLNKEPIFTDDLLDDEDDKSNPSKTD